MFGCAEKYTLRTAHCALECGDQKGIDDPFSELIDMKRHFFGFRSGDDDDDSKYGDGCGEVDDIDGDADNDDDGASPNSHKHFFPYMGFCASIWDNVRHHCHRHHHHHHHIQKSKSINTEACLIPH